MNNTLSTLVTILIVFAGAWILRGELYPKVINNTVTDTLRVDVPYEVTKIKEVEKPVRVTEYKTRVDTVTKAVVLKDTVFIYTDEKTYGYNQTFLTNYTNTPKFLGLNYTGEKLSFTGLYPNGLTQTKTWNVTNKLFELGYTKSGDITIKKSPTDEDNIHQWVEAGWWQPLLQKQGEVYFSYTFGLTIFDVGLSTKFYLKQEPAFNVGINYEF